MNQRISIHIATRDRSTELALLLSSLRVQTYQDFDVVIVDGSQPNSIFSVHFVNLIINQLKMEGHGVYMRSINIPGVCYARQSCLENDTYKNPLICRVDDDVILQPDYLEKLLEGINKGYDLVSGLTPNCGIPPIMRESKYVKPFISRIDVKDDGTITHMGDDCAFTYDTQEIIPTCHFRSCALYKREIHDNANDYKLGLSMVGFREELFISLKAILAGYKLAVHTGAINWHLRTPSGGCRFPNYEQLVMLDEQRMQGWLKRKMEEKGNFIEEYKKRVVL